MKKHRRPRKLKGVGDVVALVAGPLARGLDVVFRTRAGSCRGCEGRKEWLNEKFPFKGEGPLRKGEELCVARRGNHHGE